jgi:hypothetical protein
MYKIIWDLSKIFLAASIFLSQDNPAKSLYCQVNTENYYYIMPKNINISVKAAYKNININFVNYNIAYSY